MVSFRVLVIVLFATLTAQGQKRKFISESLDGVGTQDSYGIKFEYSGMLVGNDIEEAAYLKQKRSDWEMK